MPISGTEPVSAEDLALARGTGGGGRSGARGPARLRG